MSITMTDGKRIQTIGEHESVRRRILEEQGWGIVEPQMNPQPEPEPDPDTRDLETQILDGTEALAPEAVKAAKKAKKARKPASMKDLPTL